MQQRVEHEFNTDENQALLRLSEELSRFSLTTGVVGMSLVGLGIAAIVTGGYASGLAGPASIILGLVAMVGGAFFLKPRATFTRITYSRGGDVTKLMDALQYLDGAHGVFRILLVLFLVLRIASFMATRIG
jgi:hypothetical protein